MKYKLLTASHGNPKTAKGLSQGHSTAILMLAHADTSVVHGGINVCPHSTPGCRATCLGEQGRGSMHGAQHARIQRTLKYANDTLAFMDTLTRDIEKHIANCAKAGLVPTVRLNGTSDIRWENYYLAYTEKTFFESFPDLQFYDYTAYNVLTMRRRIPSNYHLTFSRKETTPNSTILDHINAGINVAVVFNIHKKSPLPTLFLGIPVIDGDINDLRFLDPRGVIVGLRAKGSSRHDKSGFVIQP